MTEEEVEDYYPMNALPPDSVINDIFRYETAAQKKFDWALQRLLESQQRRQKTQAAVSVQLSERPVSINSTRAVASLTGVRQFTGTGVNQLERLQRGRKREHVPAPVSAQVSADQ